MPKLRSFTQHLCSVFAVLAFSCLLLVTGQPSARSAENVTIAIISFSPYAPWYIVKERGLAKDIELDIRIIEDITAKNAGLTSGSVHCMMNTLDSVVVARSADVPVKVIGVPAMSYGLDEMVVAPDIKSRERPAGQELRCRLRFPQSHVDAFDVEEGRYRVRQAGSQDHAAPGQRRRLC